PRPSLSGLAVPWRGGETIDTDLGSSVPPGSLSLARTSMWIGPFTGVGTTSLTATCSGGAGGLVGVVVVGVVGAGSLNDWTPASVGGAGAGVVVVAATIGGAVVVVVAVGGGAGGTAPGNVWGAGVAAAASGGRVKLSPNTCVAGAACNGRRPARSAVIAARPPAAVLRAGWFAWRGISGNANKAPSPRAQRTRPSEMSRNARTTSGSKSRPAQAASSWRAASGRSGCR